MKKLISLTLLTLVTYQNFSQVRQDIIIEGKSEYHIVKDPLVLQKLEDWQDLKFGLFMHWGTYSQWGIVESWSLSSEKHDFIIANRPESLHPDYEQYKKDYKNLQRTFNPVAFNPENWVEAAKDAGMKYVVFTTKHHDGFCMFDTKTTDYKITSLKCPFHVNQNSDVTKAIFNTFQKENFMIGAYFSKPDWNSEYYWWPYFATPDRNANYDPLNYPERWQKFKEFTYNQIEELMTDYGKVDILWLDGGQVRPSRNNQDINMPGIAEMARKNQPGLIVVDRLHTGPFENYLTPEQHIPENALPFPWESCITMGTSWSYKFNDDFKTSRELVHILVDIVAKGGNFLLNVGPGPHGDFDPVVYERLKEIGSWMKVNGEAIYSTRAVKPFKYENICLTRAKNTNTVYAIYLENEQQKGLPSEMEIKGISGDKKTKISMLGKNVNLKWRNTDLGIIVGIPENVRKLLPCEYAWTVKISDAVIQ